MFVNLNICLYFQVCTKLGPLVAFESILSVHGDEVSMLNDMIVVVEDLRNVEFNLILVDKKSKFKLKRNSSQAKSSPAVPMLEYHSFPLPRITGSRSSLKVHNEFFLRIVMKTLIYRNESASSEMSSTFIKNFCCFYKAYLQQKDMLEYHSFPLPRITRSRSSLKVHNGLISFLKENS